MATRTLPSLAHSLGVAPDLDAALIALGEALADDDRSAILGLVRYDGRKGILRERLSPQGGVVVRTTVDTTFDHLPPALRSLISAAGQFVDVGERSPEYARLLALSPFADGGFLSLRGLTTDGALTAVLALYEQRKMFGTRTSERFAPSIALFELAYQRFADREARDEAVQTLEEVTQRVHGDYLRKLGSLEEELGRARGAAAASGGGGDASQLVHLEHALARQEEDTRRTERRAQSLEQQLTAAVAQLEQAHIELHRRSEGLRQKTRTGYLIERALRLDNATMDPRQLVDGLLALVGDDMQAQRCTLMLRVPGEDALYLAATRGLAPQIVMGARIAFGHGVAGIVAQSREPLLVQDATEARAHPLLTDQFLTTGSFISFPLIYLDELIGVVNLTDRAKRGVFLEEDVERVQLLALVMSLIATNGSLAERLLGTMHGQ